MCIDISRLFSKQYVLYFSLSSLVNLILILTSFFLFCTHNYKYDKIFFNYIFLLHQGRVLFQKVY